MTQERVYTLPRRVLLVKSWRGDSEGHAEAARKGWERRTRPPELHGIGQKDARRWFVRNVAEKEVLNEGAGVPVRFDRWDASHAISKRDDDGNEVFAPERARRLPWLIPVAENGTMLDTGKGDNRPLIVSVFVRPRIGAHALVVEYDAEAGVADFVTHFPLKAARAKRLLEALPRFKAPRINKALVAEGSVSPGSGLRVHSKSYIPRGCRVPAETGSRLADHREDDSREGQGHCSTRRPRTQDGRGSHQG